MIGSVGRVNVAEHTTDQLNKPAYFKTSKIKIRVRVVTSVTHKVFSVRK